MCVCVSHAIFYSSCYYWGYTVMFFIYRSSNHHQLLHMRYCSLFWTIFHFFSSTFSLVFPHFLFYLVIWFLNFSNDGSAHPSYTETREVPRLIRSGAFCSGRKWIFPLAVSLSRLFQPNLSPSMPLMSPSELFRLRAGNKSTAHVRDLDYSYVCGRNWDLETFYIRQGRGRPVHFPFKYI